MTKIFEGIKNQKGGQNNCRRKNRAFYKPVEVIFFFCIPQYALEA